MDPWDELLKKIGLGWPHYKDVVMPLIGGYTEEEDLKRNLRRNLKGNLNRKSKKSLKINKKRMKPALTLALTYKQGRR